MSLPTVTINELSARIQDDSTNKDAKKVLTGLLSDFMDLQYGKETPYTTGQQVVPTGATIEDVDGALNQETDKKFKDVFEKISETEKSGDFTPQAVTDGSWDSKFTPVLVLIRGNK